MTAKELLLREIENTPENLIEETLDFLRFIKTKKKPPYSSNISNPYPLRQTPFTYIDPTEPVASEDWGVLS